MTPRQISEMKHAIGLDHKHPVRGRYVPYRNYFRTEGGSHVWDELVAQGLATMEGSGRFIDYVVTFKGMDALSEVEGCSITEPSLELVLKAEYYDLIDKGIKLDEYRDITPFWRKRICQYQCVCKMKDVCKANINCHDAGVWCKHSIVTFHRGYTKTKMRFKIEHVFVGFGNPEWGAEPGKKYFVIKLGERLS